MNDKKCSVVKHGAWFDAEVTERLDVVGSWVDKARNLDEVVHRMLGIPQDDLWGLIETLRSVSRP